MIDFFFHFWSNYNVSPALFYTESVFKASESHLKPTLTKRSKEKKKNNTPSIIFLHVLL